MKVILKLLTSLLVLCFLLIAICFGLSWLGLNSVLSSEPEVNKFDKASLEDLKKIKRLAVNVNTPTTNDEPRSIILSERDINLSIGHFGPSFLTIPPKSYAKVNFTKNVVEITLTTPAEDRLREAERELRNSELTNHSMYLPVKNFLLKRSENKWLNLGWKFSIDSNAENKNWIKSGKISIGSITLSQAISDKIVDTIFQQIKQSNQGKIALESWNNIKNLNLENKQLTIDFILPKTNNSSYAKYTDLIFTKDEKALIDIYSKKLSKLPRFGNLRIVIASLFQFAYERSNQTLDPVAENKAALLALSRLYGAEKLASMIDLPPNEVIRRMPKPYSLYGRKDLPLHLILSAGLTLVSDQNIAELIGIDKEIGDFSYGSKVSAWDLLADKAGIKLAEKATRSAKSARDLQVKLGKAKRDQDILPDIGKDLNLSNDRFSVDELADLNELVELYLEKHPLYKM